MANTSVGDSTDAFEEATRRLNEDTVGLLAQIEILERQKTILLSTTDTSSHAPQDGVQQAIKRQRAQLSLQMQQTGAALQEKLGSNLQSVDAMVESLPDIVGRALIKDDRVLDNLQRIAPRLEVNDDLDSVTHRTDTLCKNYALLESQAVAIRIDDTYQKALTAHHSAPQQGSLTDVVNLRAELEELHGEVNGLVQLIAEHHYRIYIQQAAERLHLAAADEASRWSEHTAGTLLYLIARLEALEELIKHAHLHKSAILELQSELNATTKEKARPEPRHQHSGSTTGLKPLRLVQSSLSQNQDQVAPLLKLLDINARLVSTTALTDLLAVRRTSSKDIEAKSHAALLEQVTGSLAEGTEHVDALMKVMSSYYQNEDRSILSEDQAASLQQLESRIATTARSMQDFDVEKIAADIASQ